VFRPSGLITLLTDFGTADVFVGVMKGVIAGVNSSARVIDLSHAVEPYDPVEAACLLRDAYPCFPAGTVHVVVVDPGVGTSRRILAMSAAGHAFLAPDNGILDPIVQQAGVEELVEVREPRFFRPRVSATFHGRDIFAPVAAHLSRGTPLSDLGPAAGPHVRLRLPEPQLLAGGRIIGQVLRFDRFGNAVTNIAGDLAARGAAVRVRVAGLELPRVCATFGDVPEAAAVAYVGSFGCLEIAVRRGSARESLGLSRGDPVELIPAEPQP